MVNSYDPLADGTTCKASFWQPLATASGAVANVGFRPHGPYEYIFFKEDSTYYRRNGKTGEVDDSNSNAATLINNTINVLPNFGSIRLKGDITITSPLVFNGTNMVGGVTTNFWFDFDRIQVSGNVDALQIQNLSQSFRICGKKIRNTTLNNSASLIKFDGQVRNGFVSVDYLYGDWTNGKTIGVTADLGTGDVLNNTTVTTKRPYALEKVFYMNLVDTSWASVNRFDLGLFESASPRQIHIFKSGSDSIHNNLIRGVGGAPNTWNPQALAPIWAIKMETAAGGKIYNTTFFDFHIYSPVDEIYRADSGVVGTKFIGGMPNYHAHQAWWHDTGSGTEFVTAWDATLNKTFTKLITQSAEIFTFANDDLTPSVATGNIFKTATGHGAAKDITMFDEGYNGQIITIISSNPANATTIKDGGNLLIGGDWVDGAEKTLKLVFDGTNWYEISRR